ncbi:ABC-type transport auxiliary lipoprotein family protein [Lysobacter yangpyeongensis]|jgi:cholesterol transport system auxiliary component|uniref:ABC-type transport auxiliary lipoprotein family protein n=1 Tax=Lysobacter yangpyeongensis TaxID=346182 RepID=A0ABW0SN12_9GAMM
MSTASLRIAAWGLLVPMLLSGCTSLLGGSRHPTSIYAPEVHRIDAQGWPQVHWQLAMGRTTGARTADSLRILVRPAPNEVQVYKDAQWAKSPGDMLEDGVLHALEDSGRIAVVARQGSGFAADYRLMLDVRRFESDYAGGAVPSATIEVTAKLLHVKDQQLAGSRTFLQTQPAATTAVADVVAAFDQALTAVTGELAGWTLATGEQHERSTH